MYRVTNTADAARQFRDLLQQAIEQGKKDLFTQSASQLAADLANHPLATGESREPEPAGGFYKRVAFYPFICVRYGVHPTGKQVLITRISRNGG